VSGYVHCKSANPYNCCCHEYCREAFFLVHNRPGTGRGLGCQE
jgi:hypothetical protein